MAPCGSMARDRVDDDTIIYNAAVSTGEKSGMWQDTIALLSSIASNTKTP